MYLFIYIYIVQHLSLSGGDGGGEVGGARLAVAHELLVEVLLLLALLGDLLLQVLQEGYDLADRVRLRLNRGGRAELDALSGG